MAVGLAVNRGTSAANGPWSRNDDGGCRDLAQQSPPPSRQAGLL